MAYPKTRTVRLWRAVGGPAFRFLMSTLCQVTVRGREYVPPYSPYFIAFNHVDTLDAPLVTAFWPYLPEGLTAAENYSNPVIGTLMRLYGAIPLARSQYDREALSQGMAVIQAGSPLIVAPEGTRSRRPGMHAAKPGLAFLALKTRAPIIPVGITGTQDWIPEWRRWHRPQLGLTIGRLFDLPEEPINHENRRAKMEEYTNLIMQRIAELLPVEYRGVYA
jgi:1-acyl-sn-glycerol-3-phosphate acyltransferase